MKKLYFLLFFYCIACNIYSQCISYDVKVCIDGSDTLKIQGDSMWWAHRNFSPPGTHSDCISNTGVTITVNDSVWSPWNVSYKIQNISGYTLTLDSITCAKICYLIQAPDSSNGWKTMYFFNDDGLGAAHLYEVILKFCANIPPPVAVFQTNDTIFCTNSCTSFTDSSMNATSWRWSFAGGTPSSSTDQNPQVCYPSPGLYDVKLIASNPGGSDSLTLHNYINVKPPPPTPAIYQNNNILYCNADTAYVSYQWYDSTMLIAGATDTSISITHSGNYNLQVSNGDSCKIAVGINVIFTGMPVAAFQANDSVICTNSCVSFSDISIYASSWQWNFTGGTPSSSIDQNPQVCYASPGLYDVKLIASNSGGSDSLTLHNYINVKALPSAPAVYQNKNMLYCNVDTAYVSYQWYDSTQLIAGATDTSIVITHSGSYNLQVSNGDSCKNTAGINAIFTALPVAAFQADNTRICTNDCVTYTDRSIGATSLEWSFAGGTPSSSTDQNPQVCYQSPGLYDVSLVVSNAGGSDSLTLHNYINVKPLPPAPAIYRNGNIIYCNADTGYASYQWYYSTILIVGATDTAIFITQSGRYNLQVSNSDSCRNTAGITVILTDVGNHFIHDGFLVFPNPMTSAAKLEFSYRLEESELIIYDVLGKEMRRKKVSGNYVDIERENLVSGVYFVSVKNNKAQFLQKIIVE